MKGLHCGPFALSPNTTRVLDVRRQSVAAHVYMPMLFEIPRFLPLLSFSLRSGFILFSKHTNGILFSLITYCTNFIRYKYFIKKTIPGGKWQSFNISFFYCSINYYILLTFCESFLILIKNYLLQSKKSLQLKKSISTKCVYFQQFQHLKAIIKRLKEFN